MDRRELFKIIDVELEKVRKQDDNKSLFKLTKVLNKIEVEDIQAHKTSLKNGRRVLINFIESLEVISPDILAETIVLSEDIEDIEISYTDLLDAIKDILSNYSIIMGNYYLRPIITGMLSSLFSAYLDRTMPNNEIIKEVYNFDLKVKQESMKDIYLASRIKNECGQFSEDVAIGFVHRERMKAEEASYPSSRLLKILNEDVKECAERSMLEALAYFASVTFYNRCREDYPACINQFKRIFQTNGASILVSKRADNIYDIIPLLIQMGFPIKQVDGKIEIDFEELNNQINIMKESMKEKTLIIR